jgi:hypothetical protein
MWTDMRTLVRAVYPALLLLRMADEKKPGMDKLYFYVRRMEETIHRSKELLDEMDNNYHDNNGDFSKHKMFQYFLQTKTISDYCNEFKEKDDFSNDDDSVGSESDMEEAAEEAAEEPADDGDDSDDDSTVDDDDTAETLGDKVKSRWDHRKQKLITDLSITGWMLSPSPEIMKDVNSGHTGEHRNAVERVLKRWILHKVSLICNLTFFSIN